ncbi:hypothetical protein S2091_1089 [Solimicrobium silvestre]|uniref:Uncharacterized protein n=1 Tax=Solimicrobium silvestre TaxID=2099400 RepID=A0A2S9H3B6_9BURK|nr:hypothetical protein S2091_1089 [Solimicrobium silvestre]
MHGATDKAHLAAEVGAGDTDHHVQVQAGFFDKV